MTADTGATQDLFGDGAHPASPAPLAERLRPQTIDEVIGQTHLLGPGKPLRLAFDAGRLHSMILWGPPGVGKTTLARLAARHFNADFIQISAVLAGVKDIREAVERARVNRQAGRETILFVDEVHRFNKAQQDAFLPHVESGLITFIGATTENPSFEVVGALLSRAQVYVLRPLNETELAALLRRALDRGGLALELDDAARELLIAYADGDGRRLLNLLEQLAVAARTAGRSAVDAVFAAEALAPARRRFDKGGEAFYDQISALHKSVRGSDPDASLYWLARMLDGGADPLYLACAPKSNAVYTAWNAALAFVQQDGSREVPLHLRNAPTRLMQALGYGRAYRYAHDEPEAYAAGETYLPDGMPPVSFYTPTPRGLEARIAERLAHLRELDARAEVGEKRTG